jgi:hypothetical protein
MTRLIPLLLLAALGCGYVVGSPFRPDVHTVAVPIFENDTFRRGWEFQLTEQIQKELMRRGLRVAQEPYADTRLTGKIVEIRKDVTGESAFDDPRQLQISLAVVVQWEDLRTGQFLAEQQILLPPESTQFASTTRLAPEVGQSLASSNQEVIELMARQIVNRMEMPW